jgi:hypothetical protein
MWDKKAIINLCVIGISYACYNLYLYELFWGEWNKALAKAFFYSITAVTLLWFTYWDYKGHETIPQLHSSTVYKLSLVVTFILFNLTLTGKLNNPVYYLIGYNSAIFFITFIILVNGTRFEYFKD